jgi:hypothetical protein
MSGKAQGISAKQKKGQFKAVLQNQIKARVWAKTNNYQRKSDTAAHIRHLGIAARDLDQQVSSFPGLACFFIAAINILWLHCIF